MTRYAVIGAGIETSEAAALVARRFILARERQQEAALDEALAESFPASDPPSWNPGMARPVPVPSRTAAGPPASDASGRTFGQMVTSLAAVAGLALLVPAVVLLVGTPVALVVRAALELVEWVSSAVR